MKLWEKLVLQIGELQIEGVLTLDERFHKIWKFDGKIEKDWEGTPTIHAVAEDLTLHTIKTLQHLALKANDTFSYELVAHIDVG